MKCVLFEYKRGVGHNENIEYYKNSTRYIGGGGCGMITIKPFCAARPTREYVSRVAALPYDVVTGEEAKEEMKRNPYSFLNVDKAEPIEEAGVYLEWMLANGVFEVEKEESFYLYGLEVNGRTQYGVVGCFACEDYETGRIKKHENTTRDKEEERVLHVEACKAHTGPIFMAYKESGVLEELIESYKKHKERLYDFEEDSGLRQVIYHVDQEDQGKIQDAFQQLDALYIADGHHRAAAACRYAKKEGVSGEAKNYFLGVAFPKDELHIMDYNRVVSLESDLNEAYYFKKLNEIFKVTLIEGTVFKPSTKHEIGMRYKKQWYALAVKEGVVEDDPIKGLDVAILQDYILTPLFGISEPRIDKRLQFIGGIRGIEALNEKSNEPNQIAFSMYPTSFDEIIAVADVDGLMPPKSTWFEPKLRSGLLIHFI